MIKILILLVAAATAYSEERIVNGEDVTSMTTAPWQVSLQQGTFHFCGGSLIAAQYVMSAAHCQSNFVTANLGSPDRTNPEQRITVSTFTTHPSFGTGIATNDYDYAVLRLASPASLNSNVATIALPPAGAPDYSGYTAQISGWGQLSGSNSNAPTILQVADAPIVTPSACKSAWGTFSISDRMVCAGGSGTSGCMGDSGGPLAVQDTDGTWILVGNTSWGSSSCITSRVAVWSRNSAALDWINAQMS